MQRIGDQISIICLILIAAFSLAWCMISVTPKFLICQVWDYQKSDWKTIRCLKTDPQLRGNYATEVEPTATGYPYTPEPTETETPTATLSAPPYPEPIDTATAFPYPAPQGAMATAYFDWWGRLR